MEYKIIKDEKNELEIEIDNLTVAEILRIALNKDDSVKFAAWRRDHIMKNPIILIKTDGKSAKKALQDSIGSIEKQLDKLLEDFKKSSK